MPGQDFLYDKSVPAGMLKGSVARHHLQRKGEQKEQGQGTDTHLEDGHPKGRCPRSLAATSP